MRENILNWITYWGISSAGITATFALANQLLGTVAVVMTISFAVWRHIEDRKYVKKRNERVKRKVANEDK